MSTRSKLTSDLRRLLSLSPDKLQSTLNKLSPEHRTFWLKRLQYLQTSTLDFVTQRSPQYTRPYHLQPLTDALDAHRRGERQFMTVSVPPRFGKTETIMHAFAQILQEDPTHRIGYVSYSDDIAIEKSTIARELCNGLNINIRQDIDNKKVFRTVEGGGMVFSGIYSGLTGKGFDLIVVDDPHKDRTEAEQTIKRVKVWRQFIDTVRSRLQPGGSIIVVMQRWNTDDLVARIQQINKGRWKIFALPFILDIKNDDPKTGRSLFPEMWPLQELLDIIEDMDEGFQSYNIQSQYMQNPKPIGGLVFKRPIETVPYYDTSQCRLFIALDAAGTTNITSDYSACIAAYFNTSTQEFIIVDGWYGKHKPTDTAHYVLEFVKRNGFANIFIEATRDGKEVAALLDASVKGLAFEFVTPIGDKFARSQPLSAAFNAGRVKILAKCTECEWFNDPKGGFAKQFKEFTGGTQGCKDDFVDATAHAYNAAVIGDADNSIPDNFILSRSYTDAESETRDFAEWVENN